MSLPALGIPRRLLFYDSTIPVGCKRQQLPRTMAAVAFCQGLLAAGRPLPNTKRAPCFICQANGDSVRSTKYTEHGIVSNTEYT